MRWVIVGLALLLGGCVGSRKAQESENGLHVWKSDTPWGR